MIYAVVKSVDLAFSFHIIDFISFFFWLLPACR